MNGFLDIVSIQIIHRIVVCAGLILLLSRRHYDRLKGHHEMVIYRPGISFIKHFNLNMVWKHVIHGPNHLRATSTGFLIAILSTLDTCREIQGIRIQATNLRPHVNLKGFA